MLRHLAFLLICICTFSMFAGCASSQSRAPRAVTDFPNYEFYVLRAADVRLTILDQRSNRRDSERLVARLNESLMRALGDNGVVLESAGPTELVVRVTQLRADIRSGNWRGCTRFVATYRDEGRAEQVEAESCVERFNLWGRRTANKVLRDSFEDALAQLLANLDALI